MVNFSKSQREANLLSDYMDLFNSGAQVSPADFMEQQGESSETLVSLLSSIHALRNFVVHHGFPSLSPDTSTRLFRRVEEQLEKYGRAINKTPSNLAAILNQREDFLILLIHFMNQVWGRTKLVKMLLLLGKEAGCDRLVDNFYGHYAYNFGAFDENVPNDVDRLESRNIINKRIPPSSRQVVACEVGVPSEKRVETIYELTPRGKTIARKLVAAVEQEEPEVINRIKDIVHKYGKMSTDDLLDYTYNKYREYTTKSLIRDKYLREKKDSNDDENGGKDAAR